MWKIGVRDWVITVNLVNSTNYLEQVFSPRIFIFQFLSSLWLLDTFCFSLERVWQQICQQFLYFSCLTTGILVLPLNVNLTSCTLIYILHLRRDDFSCLETYFLEEVCHGKDFMVLPLSHMQTCWETFCNACMIEFWACDWWLIDRLTDLLKN